MKPSSGQRLRGEEHLLPEPARPLDGRSGRLQRGRRRGNRADHHGDFYYVIKIDDNVIQLAATYCDAVGTAGDPTNCPADVPNPSPPPTFLPHPVRPIALSPDKSTVGIDFTQTLTRPQNMPIPGLTEGGVYYILAGVDGSHFQLGFTPTGSAIGLGTTYGGIALIGPNHFAVESVDIISKGSGSQNLVIDITSHSSGTQQMVGIGGPSHLVSAPTGDRVTTARPPDPAAGSSTSVPRTRPRATTRRPT